MENKELAELIKVKACDWMDVDISLFSERRRSKNSSIKNIVRLVLCDYMTIQEVALFTNSKNHSVVIYSKSKALDNMQQDRRLLRLYEVLKDYAFELEGKHVIN